MLARRILNNIDTHFPGKGQSWEGGIRVPTVVSWPARIPPGITINEPTNSFDIFPTMANIAGATIPDDRVIDGKDIMPLLTQQQQISPHEFMFHYCAKKIHAVRYRPRDGTTTWKAHFKTPKWIPGTQGCRGMCHECYEESSLITHNPPLLFDITADPSESQPIESNSIEYKEVIYLINMVVIQHIKTVSIVPNQLDKNTLFDMAGLQPCCNYPFCSCTENIQIKNIPRN